jgi:hypothetical protein
MLSRIAEVDTESQNTKICNDDGSPGILSPYTKYSETQCPTNREQWSKQSIKVEPRQKFTAFFDLRPFSLLNCNKTLATTKRRTLSREKANSAQVLVF